MTIIPSNTAGTSNFYPILVHTSLTDLGGNEENIAPQNEEILAQPATVAGSGPDESAQGQAHDQSGKEREEASEMPDDIQVVLNRYERRRKDRSGMTNEA